jgi:hypothetical protein
MGAFLWDDHYGTVLFLQRVSGEAVRAKRVKEGIGGLPDFVGTQFNGNPPCLCFWGNRDIHLQ